MWFILWRIRGVQEHVASRWFVPGCTARSNEIICCVRGSWNWEWSNYFSCKLSARFPVTFQVTETAVALKLGTYFTGNVILNQPVALYTGWEGWRRCYSPPSLLSPLPPLTPPQFFPHIFFSLLPLLFPQISRDCSRMTSHEGARRFAIWRPGWLRRLRWQCVGSWRRDGRGLYWRRQRCGCQWGADWHNGLQLEGVYCIHLSGIMLHACATIAAGTVPPVLDHSYFWKRYSVPVRIYVVMLHGIP
jgi:hypothetical protein